MDNNIIKDIEKVLISDEELAEIVKKLGAQISEDYKNEDLILVSILKGSVIFMAVSSYADGTESTGIVKIIKDLDISIEGKNLLIIEDILDSGRTLSYIKEMLLTRKPKSIKICTLFDKPERRQVDLYADYIGCKVPNEFIVGYGLDYNEYYRNLPYIGALKRSVYEK